MKACKYKLSRNFTNYLEFHDFGNWRL